METVLVTPDPRRAIWLSVSYWILGAYWLTWGIVSGHWPRIIVGIGWLCVAVAFPISQHRQARDRSQANE